MTLTKDYRIQPPPQATGVVWCVPHPVRRSQEPGIFLAGFLSLGVSKLTDLFGPRGKIELRKLLKVSLLCCCVPAPAPPTLLSSF